MKYLVFSTLLMAAIGFFNASANAETTFVANLTGGQEVPATNSAATGFGRLVLNDAENTIDVYLDFSGLSSANSGTHIHGAALPGVNAPILFNLGTTNATTGSFIQQFSVTAQQVADLKAGKWYLNAHSANFQGGEIRGQLTAYAPYIARMTAAQVVPPTNSAASGICKILINESGTQISATITYQGLDPFATATLLFVGGRAGETGSYVDQISNAVNVLMPVTPEQAAQIKSGRAYVYAQTNNFPLGEIRGQVVQSGRLLPDFDGDRRADLSVFRPSDTVWYNFKSGGAIDYRQWGLSTDRPVPEDYDGDGRTDIAVWRAGLAGQAAFYILNSSDNSVRVELFGQTGDDPAAVGDYDGDRRADPAVYRSGAVGSQSYFFYRGSFNNPNKNVTFVPWGTTGDQAVAGDFNADGRRDFAVFRLTDATWYILPNGNPNGAFAKRFGLSTDTLAPADYDGDGQTDLAVYRASTAVWYIEQSGNGAIRYEKFGLAADKPVPADYDGDGRADIAVWRAGDGVFYLLQSANGFSALKWGSGGDFPVAGFQTRDLSQLRPEF